jgi:hypothetical protein
VRGELFSGVVVVLLPWREMGRRGLVVTLTDEEGDESGEGDEKKS